MGGDEWLLASRRAWNRCCSIDRFLKLRFFDPVVIKEYRFLISGIFNTLLVVGRVWTLTVYTFRRLVFI